MVAAYEEEQRLWRERIAAQLPVLEEEGRYEEALLLVGRNNAPTLLRRWFEAGSLSLDELRRLLPGVWDLCEYPRDHGVRWWVRAFKTVGPIGDVPAEAVTVYRGAVPQASRGMAWTRDLTLARWFAERPQMFSAGRVYRVTVSPAAILFAGTNGRGEDEIVANPFMLRSIHEVAPDPHAVSCAVKPHEKALPSLLPDSGGR